MTLTQMTMTTSPMTMIPTPTMILALLDRCRSQGSAPSRAPNLALSFVPIALADRERRRRQFRHTQPALPIKRERQARIGKSWSWLFTELENCTPRTVSSFDDDGSAGFCMIYALHHRDPSSRNGFFDVDPGGIDSSSQVQLD